MKENTLLYIIVFWHKVLEPFWIVLTNFDTYIMWSVNRRSRCTHGKAQQTGSLGSYSNIHAEFLTLFHLNFWRTFSKTVTKKGSYNQGCRSIVRFWKKDWREFSKSVGFWVCMATLISCENETKTKRVEKSWKIEELILQFFQRQLSNKWSS